MTDARELQAAIESGVKAFGGIDMAVLNAGVFSFFVTPMSDELGWSRSALSWALTWRLLIAGV